MAQTLEYPTGLTTTEAAFIENSREHGRLYIEQPYELYTAENHRPGAPVHSDDTIVGPLCE